MDIQPIRNDEEHRAVLAAIKIVLGRCCGPLRRATSSTYSALVDSYESRRWPIASSTHFDPIDVLRQAIDEPGIASSKSLHLLGARVRDSWPAGAR